VFDLSKKIYDLKEIERKRNEKEQKGMVEQRRTRE
jgi:hypothetical protein